MIDFIKKIYNKKEIRFLFVGGLNTLIGYGTYALFIYLNMNYFLANLLSTVIGVFHSYLWNRFFTFKSHDRAINEILRFIMVYFISFIFSNLVLFVFVTKLNMNKYLVGLISLIFTTLISWFGHKYYSFRSVNNEKNFK